MARKNILCLVLFLCIEAVAIFALKDSGNGLLGQLRETSVFLGENGGAGTVQEIDFAV